MSVNNKQWYGLPLNLIWGYVAIAVFMTGDGFELAFLSHYIKALGFTPAQASFAFTLYGLAAALSAWVSGVVAEIITPRKAMLIGFVLWCVFHVLFLVFGLGRANYALHWNYVSRPSNILLACVGDQREQYLLQDEATAAFEKARDGHVKRGYQVTFVRGAQKP